jgi:pyruvate dehydrogenase E2 component (dihydrolipoamide acetyltransferase)
MARDAGLNLAEIPATGDRGVVRRSDVERVLAEGQERQPDGAAPARQAETRIPLVGVRRAVADKLSRSRREIPEATVWVDVDATELLRARAVLNDGQPSNQVSLLALLGRFTVLALRRYPELNASVDGDEIVIPDAVNLGFAAQTDRGLVVPVVHSADRLTTRELSARMQELTRAARAASLTPQQLTGGTCTVNNYGVFGVDGSAAIINHPEVALVGMGRIIDRPWVVDGQLAVRKVTQLTLAFDHRVCDGGTAGGFLRLLADCVEAPIRALGDV